MALEQFGQGTLDRPPTLPPDVQPSSFNRLVESGEEGGAQSMGGMQKASIAMATAMGVEKGLMTLQNIIDDPNFDGLVARFVEQFRPLLLAALRQTSQGSPVGAGSPLSSLAGGVGGGIQ